MQHDLVSQISSFSLKHIHLSIYLILGIFYSSVYLRYPMNSDIEIKSGFSPLSPLHPFSFKLTPNKIQTSPYFFIYQRLQIFLKLFQSLILFQLIPIYNKLKFKSLSPFLNYPFSTPLLIIFFLFNGSAKGNCNHNAS